MGTKIFWCLLLLLCGAAQAQTQSILPNGMTQFEDGNGAPYAGGHVYMYVPGTTTPKATYQDPYGKIPNQNPVTLDANGRALLWGNGLYRQVLQDLNGVTVWDQQTLAGGGSTSVGTAGVDQYLVTASPYNAKCDGVTDDTAAIQSAINAAQTAGGGEVLIPVTASGCYLVGTLSITHSGITISGSVEKGTPRFPSTASPGAVLTFANGSADDIDVGFQTPEADGVAIRDLFINHSGKTGGTAISWQNVGYPTIENVFENNCFNGVWWNRVNNAVINHSVVECTVNGNAFALKYYTTFSRSDVLTINDTVVNDQNAPAVGFEWDGASNSVRSNNFSILKTSGPAFKIDNTSGATAGGQYPQFGYFNDLEIDGIKATAMQINSGNYISFVNSIVDSTADTNTGDRVVAINPDLTGGVTRGINFIGTTIENGPGQCLYDDQKNSVISGSQFYSCPYSATGPADAVIELGADTNGINITGNTIGYMFGQAISPNANAVRIDSGAARVILGSNDYTLANSPTNAAISNGTSGTVVLSAGGIDSDGSLFGPAETYGGAGGTNELFVKNPSIAANTKAQISVSTGTTNAYALVSQNDGGVLTGQFGCGSGDSNGCTFMAGAGPATLSASAGDVILSPQSAGAVQFANAGSFAVNGSGATTLGSNGPGTTAGNPSKWLLIKDNGGGKYLIPVWLCGGC